MKKPLIIIFSIIIGFAVLGVVIFLVVSLTSKKMECKSSLGNITIMYNDNTITGYAANGITYDLDQQKLLAEQVGVEDYLDEFEDWFEDNTNGTCSR